MKPSAAQHRPVRSFVLRQGRLSPAQARACATLLPVFGIAYGPRSLDLDAAFGRQAPRVLEIGFGMGDTTAAIAAAQPQTDFLALEVHTPGVGSLLKQIDEQGLRNIRIIQHDAVEVISQMLAPGTLDGVHVFFPDPWHKSRHNKRRLIQAPFVRKLADRLQAGGYLHCATDWQPYAEQMLEVLSGETSLRNSAAGYAERPSYRPLTKFENRGLKLGHGVWDLVFERV